MIVTESDCAYLISAIDHASIEIMAIYGQRDKGAHLKEDGSPVTTADLLANQLLVSALSRRWPQVPILSEESVNTFLSSDRPSVYWAIDPLDGTKEFIQRNGEFTVNVALIKNGIPILGMISAPAREQLYFGVVGKGLRKRQGMDWSAVVPLKQGFDITITSASIKIAVSRSHPSDELHSWAMQYQSVKQIQMGSSLKFCLVAEGAADCYPRFGPTHIWDIAAGEAILRSVGGSVLRWPVEGLSGIQYSSPHYSVNPSFIALA
ncbi:3'(2'),5'-bisphosphate nucleotidase CysQ [Polynucleobacter paneuropaeus]|nr:3'(2'),5'-bisphosphate nucleotidase CysQ [Polynucleobacter paneuropaeus]MBT8530971.1 3'(2'),5'-bisphosphate nucleotidase CysQ [Polynucleobacter paneuropaeus]MBT8602472.1 3'(2'),5'-bisphosphate nucleotidase CysQ [Polynucleobacter paneuropaeus]MBT8624425.1 3'(2'),5'-bisphosphate nucleotidase CysQ [Polynucleobacter paneuropaeus]MBT8628690.1 3'(2'),5'-bisphosphate nucleotidase CysQ [Polynucleobacter paneuropaeus]